MLKLARKYPIAASKLQPAPAGRNLLRTSLADSVSRPVSPTMTCEAFSAHPIRKEHDDKCQSS
jgi:hypothetical protein